MHDQDGPEIDRKPPLADGDSAAARAMLTAMRPADAVPGDDPRPPARRRADAVAAYEHVGEQRRDHRALCGGALSGAGA